MHIMINFNCMFSGKVVLLNRFFSVQADAVSCRLKMQNSPSQLSYLIILIAKISCIKLSKLFHRTQKTIVAIALFTSIRSNNEKTTVCVNFPSMIDE